MYNLGITKRNPTLRGSHNLDDNALGDIAFRICRARVRRAARVDGDALRATIGAAANQGGSLLRGRGVDTAIDSRRNVSEQHTRVYRQVNVLGDGLGGAVGVELPLGAVGRVLGRHAEEAAGTGPGAVGTQVRRDELHVLDIDALWVAVGSTVAELLVILSRVAGARGQLHKGVGDGTARECQGHEIGEGGEHRE